MLKTILIPKNNFLVRSLSITQAANYCDLINDGKLQASKSILIENSNRRCIDDALVKFRNIDHIYLIRKQFVNQLRNSYLTLVEFKTIDDAEEAYKSVGYDVESFPVPSNCLVYNGYGPPVESLSKENYEEINLRWSNQHYLSPYLSITNMLNQLKQDPIAMKLKFISLLHIEKFLCRGFFEEFCILPFGSAFLDYGINFGDLDLLLARKSLINSEDNTTPNYNPLSHVYRPSFSDEGEKMRYFINIFARMLREQVPLVEQHSIIPIPNARVPIIKFKTKFVPIDYDLSFDFNTKSLADHMYDKTGGTELKCSGFLMTSAMYILSKTNNIFTATTIFLKEYARATGITSSNLKGFTNFQLLTLIIFYLQNVKLSSIASSPSTYFGHDTILPPLQEIINSSKTANIEGAINLPNDMLDTVIPDIIKGFFEFYARFNFSKYAINIYNAEKFTMNKKSLIYVQDPLNKAKNVFAARSYDKESQRFIDIMIKSSKYDNPLLSLNKLNKKSN